MSTASRLPAFRNRVWAVTAALMLLPVTLPAATPAAPTRSGGVTAAPVTIRSGPRELPGTVFTPAVASGPTPAVVIVHDAGPRERSHYEPEARALAAAGITTLVYDKRTDGYSLTDRSFPALADDALAAVRALRSWPGIDPHRVGLLGRSEGGWVAPLAASRSPEVAFVVTVGASGLPPARTQAWSNITQLDHAGVRPSLLRPLGVRFTRVLVAAGMFGAADYDPVPMLIRVRQPVLAVFGEHDRSTAPGESVDIFRTALERGGNRSYTIRVVANADHELRHSTTGFGQADDFAPGYVELVASWITGLSPKPPAASADPAPPQRFRSAVLPTLAWYESLPVQLGALLAMLGAFVAYPVAGIVRRIRGRRDSSPVRKPARVLAVLGPVTVVGSVLYLGYLTATGALTIGPVVAGRPAPFLLLQLLAVAVVTAAVLTAVAWWRDRQQATSRKAIGLALTGAAIFVPWGAYWGLFAV
ncbi:prolyl oligopeptidase family serine peptidase [Plantactinospora sp. B6F1]|uniref:prolyl oligopeptidase family serine peptidase n=1 Tax=Plantactinospora sp. B6F1 TaxID=3158971 RepID=UPI00102CDD20